ncbi:MAG: 2-oxoacid:ferredoxin oxidoreductase subunit alpha [Conexivisphaera sp.]
MKSLDMLLGGPQGGGLETSSQVLTWAFARAGYGIISDREYFSNIRGRHSYIHAEASATELPRSLRYPVHLVAAMDAETVFTHFGDLQRGSYLVYDQGEDGSDFSKIPSMEPELRERLRNAFREAGIDGTLGSLVRWLSQSRGVVPIGISYASVLSDAQKGAGIVASQASRYVSAILIGAVAGLAGLSDGAVSYGLARRFPRKELYEHNLYIVRSVMSQVREKFGSPLSLDPPSIGLGELLVASGNDVVAMAKIVGGLRYQSYYPITPAADESFTLEEYESLHGEGYDSEIVVLQTEDELAAVNSAIGAALAGARSATATSGPGFDLMVEGLGWAGMNEVPVVVTYYQRGGPSTGQPTRGAQSDLLSSVFASHGEYPRIVLASGDHEEAFYDAIDALNYAERYQMPVIHLVDKFLANTIATIQVPDISRIRIDRGKLTGEVSGEYKRFDMSSPISPRAFLGQAVMWYTGDEHDEAGHITEDSENRIRIYEKRMRKLELADSEIPEERRASYYGPEDADFLLLGWGFVKGAALSALSALSADGLRGAYLHVRMFSPYPAKLVARVMSRFKPDRIIAVEHNYEAQGARLARMNTGIEVSRRILKFSGRPIYSDELARAVKSVLSGSEVEVLSYGA